MTAVILRVKADCFLCYDEIARSDTIAEFLRKERLPVTHAVEIWALAARTGTVELQSSRDVRMFEKSGSTNSFSARVLESCSMETNVKTIVGTV